MRTKLSKFVLGLMLAALLVPTMGSDGCRRGYGGYGGHGGYDESYTDVAFGFDFWPSFGYGDWGFSDSYYEEGYYYDEGYYDGGYYDDGFYDDGFYGDGYDDDWKTKNPGKKK